MLINQAKCVVGFTSSDNSFKKAITARGTKTSASDAAVATLQQKGYTVLVIPAQGIISLTSKRKETRYE